MINEEDEFKNYTFAKLILIKRLTFLFIKAYMLLSFSLWLFCGLQCLFAKRNWLKKLEVFLTTEYI